MDVGVVVVAACFAGMGALGLARPAALVGIFSTPLPHADGRNEVRAVYGGFGFGLVVAAFLLVAAGRDDPFADGLVAAVALSLAGMAGGRLVSFGLERPARLYPTVVTCGAELALAGLLVLAR